MADFIVPVRAMQRAPRRPCRLWVTLLAGGAMVLAGGGCAAPAADFLQQASDLGLERRDVGGSRFQHVVFVKPGSPADRLHVYLDGDGTPWLAGRPAADPTPRNPLVLRLLAMDPAPAAYLGRPCYLDPARDQGCAPRLWTTDRYSEEVVASLSAAVRRLVAEGGYRRIAWFGHSGGGTLAVLLAPRFAESEAVVTVAANLDTAAWAAHAWGGDLSGSLNPAAGPPLPPQLRQRHYAGARDGVVPPHLTAAAAARLGADLTVVEGYDHVCCWVSLWPRILDEVSP